MVLQIRDRAFVSGSVALADGSMTVAQARPLHPFAAYRGGAGKMPSLVADFADGTYGLATVPNGAIMPKSFADVFTFTRASTATYFDANKVMQTAAVDTPRLDHDPATGVALGLLIEESRTNGIIGSAAPATQSVTVAATAYVLSFYGSGSITLSGAASGTLGGSGAFPARATLAFTPAAGTLTLTVTGDVQFAQLEAGDGATSYIPTTTAAVTRAADDCRRAFAAEYSPDGGTIAADFIAGGDPYYAVFGSHGSVYNRCLLENVRTYFSAAGMTYALGSLSIGVGAHKAAVGCDSAGISVAVDGGAAVTGTGTVTTGSVLALIVGANGNGSPVLNGHVERISYYPFRLDDSDLQGVTA